ncbi:ABC transporter ATP-binding protein [Finegoldia magna]|uniref:ABC transporter ATP-binding protein n=2 Tax=Finegoldia magna TaxID=1260 RepID=UPI000D70DB79|nr:ATP-binding cassette domain-containing protein [Finegoldia magna]MCC3311016.1 ATP-binding cassette domain-containing protein [Finegoldia magna]PWV45127.1 putative ABC transport system ATP-binding protein [Finegoldia magna]
MQILAKNIGVKINNKAIFSDMSFKLEENKMIGITGKSGSGKTTLLNCLGLIQEISTGIIMIDGHDTSRWNDSDKTKFWHKSSSFIYQDYGIIDNETVRYNVTLNKNTSKSKEVDQVLSQVGLGGRGEELASVLSGGEKQRLGIARAIFKDAKYIFADEPTASLDSANRQLVMDLLVKQRDNGAMIIIATHDERLVEQCDEIIDMDT